MESPHLSRNAAAHILMLALVMFWGAMFVVVKDVLQFISPQLFNTLRMVVAFACLAIAYRAQWSRLTKRAWILGAGAGVCLAAGFFFQAAGMMYTTATKSAFITGLVVILVPILAVIPLLRVRGSAAPGWNVWIGAPVAFAGIVYLTTPAHTQWMLLLRTLNRGDLLTFLSALGFASLVIVLSHAADLPFTQIAMLQVGFAAIFLGVYTASAEQVFLQSNLQVWVSVAVVGVLATAAAFSIQTWAQQILPPTHTALFLTMQPLFAWLTSFVFLHERLAVRQITGALLILAGVMVSEFVKLGNHSTLRTVGSGSAV
jgi:drug/metabolite transporter (DMT)-like permease